MIKRIVCFFKGHNLEAHCSGNKICERCEQMFSTGKIYPTKPWPAMPKKEDQ